MKQHLDTIPVWDAYRSECECPLCQMEKKNEEMYVENFLGASVMEPSHRVEVNKKGFCRTHFRQLFEAGNRLGLALLTDTYMKETMALMEENARNALAAAQGEAGKSLLARMGGKKGEELDKLAAQANEAAHRCILCERLETTMERYVYTLLYMWKHESEFRAAFASSKGLCLPHYAQVLSMAPQHLSGKELVEFVDTLARLQRENLQRVEKDLEWFTLKFDYRNKDKPWGNSQDAVERAINKMRGACV